VRSRGIRLAFLAGLSFLYLLCLRAYYLDFFNDDAFCVIGARSLGAATPNLRKSRPPG